MLKHVILVRSARMKGLQYVRWFSLEIFQINMIDIGMSEMLLRVKSYWCVQRIYICVCMCISCVCMHNHNCCGVLVCLGPWVSVRLWLSVSQKSFTLPSALCSIAWWRIWDLSKALAGAYRLIVDSTTSNTWSGDRVWFLSIVLVLVPGCVI